MNGRGFAFFVIFAWRGLKLWDWNDEKLFIMGLFNAILGNASEMKEQDIQREFAPLLCEGEVMECAYKLMRDKWAFTNRRLIVVDVQGVTGNKKEYLSIPYRSIERFSVETAGTFDMDAEVKLWVRGMEEPIVQHLSRGINVAAVQRMLAQHVLNG